MADLARFLSVGWLHLAGVVTLALGEIALGQAGTLPPAATTPVDFTRDVLPILSGRCYACHGPEKQRSGLRLDQREAALEGGDSGPAIRTGDSGDSLLIQLVAGLEPDRRMPPKGDPLTPEQIGVLRAWIDAGAPYPEATTKPAATSRPAGEIDPIYEYLLSDTRELLIKRRIERLKRLPAPPAPPKVVGLTYNPIDQFIVARWEAEKLDAARTPPPACSDEAFLRRVYLDVIGRIPTLAEARAFLDDRSPDRRTKLVDALLARTDEYAAHWTPFWEEALTSSPFAVVGGIPSRGNHKQWIYDSFKENKPFDIFVAELLDPRMPGHRPVTMQNVNGKMTQVGFVLNQTHEYTVQTAANVGQVFLGTGMKCASCHSHFENAEWPQERFLAFAGLFAEDDLEKIRCEKKSGEFIPAAFPFEIAGLPPAPKDSLDARLHYLALALTDPMNPRFAKTIVNRLWKRYLGLGLFEPVDDFRLDTPPSHPELLEWLAHDFMVNGYDIKHTIRLILTSRTYQLQYDPALEDHFDVAKKTEPRYYRSPSLRRLTAEQLIDSVRVAKFQELASEARLHNRTDITALTRALGKPASRSEVSTCRPDDVAVVQALELLNGREFHEYVYSPDTLGKLVETMKPNAAIETIYLAVLERLPTPEERQLAAAFLAEAEKFMPAPGDAPPERVWFDDDTPPNATLNGSNGSQSWEWASAPDAPVLSGKRSHRQRGSAPTSQHHFLASGNPLTIQEDDVLFVHVYIDPQHPPREIMLQWNDGNWEHRAFWGEDVIAFGQSGYPSRLPMGPLPRAGEWVRLEVPAERVALKPGTQVIGMSFDQAGGVVYWDRAGAVRQPPAHTPIRDMLWALLVSPEMQYIY